MSERRRWQIRAPGKVVLAGEYAVLEGATAIVMAVDRHVMVEPGATTPGDLVAVARAETARRLGLPLPGEAFVARSSSLYAGALKLGLGSSAAVTAGAVASVYHGAGRDVEDDATRREMWSIAREVHDAIQGARGSGIDIAASLFGGMLIMRRGPGSQPSFEPWVPPPGIRWAFVWTGQEASTRALLESVRGFKEQAPRAYSRLTGEMGDLAERMARGGTKDVAVVLEVFAGYARLLDDLGRAAGARLITPPMARLLEAARDCGGAAKPSGAGGGDIVVAAFPKDGDVARFHGEARGLGMTPLDLGCARRGVHARAMPTPGVA